MIRTDPIYLELIVTRGSFKNQTSCPCIFFVPHYPRGFVRSFAGDDCRKIHAFPLAKRVTAVRACRGFSLRLKHNKAPLGIG